MFDKKLCFFSKNAVNGEYKRFRAGQHSAFFNIMGFGENGNLVPWDEMTPEQRRQRASNGGLKSSEIRRQKKNLREAAKLLLEMDIPKSQKNTRDMLRSLGVEDEDMTYAMSIMVAALSKAMKGDINAAKFIRETSGLDMQAAADALLAEAREREDVIIYLPDNGRDNELLEANKGE